MHEMSEFVTGLLQCSKLQSVHASGCQELLIGAIESQVSNDSPAVESVLPCKRLADGSKRVRVPHFLSAQSYDDDKKRRRVERRHCNVLVS
ncbi:hypothetical protein CMV_018239 [Castanea mollissima]|uniref:Uncharacterized protein n=1 Tax=Castanea mollissima TaxID=60419 RepID=A0A8J4VPT2_9ROSI|nr:hypothetical protein CMV_018239 [Castanea mollissima]